MGAGDNYAIIFNVDVFQVLSRDRFDGVLKMTVILLMHESKFVVSNAWSLVFKLSNPTNEEREPEEICSKIIAIIRTRFALNSSSKYSRYVKIINTSCRVAKWVLFQFNGLKLLHL